MDEGRISSEINTAIRTKETIRTMVERRVTKVVENARKNVNPKKLALAATGGLIFFSVACGGGHPPEVNAVSHAPSTPTEQTFSDQLGNPSNYEIPRKNEDLQTRLMEAAEKERKQQLERLRINEALQEIHGNTVIFDHAFGEESSRLQMIVPRLEQEDYLKIILKDDYISPKQLELEFGTSFRENVNLIWKKYPKVALAYYWLNEYGNHGVSVEKAGNIVLNVFGFNKQKSDFYPLQNLSSHDGSDNSIPEIVYDELGNAGVFPETQPKSLIDAIKTTYPQNARFSFSFTLGKGGFWIITKERQVRLEKVPQFNSIFDTKRDAWVYFPETAIATITNEGIEITSKTGEPIKPLSEKEAEEEREKATKESQELVVYDSPQFKKIDGYNRINAPESLPKIFKVAESFPDSAFFAAAGNTEDDLRTMKDKQPKNLVFIAQWNSFKSGPDGRVDGADLYVDNYSLGLGAGSSFSTPAISALADILEFYGLNNKQIIKTLKSSTDPVTYERDGEIFHANLFNPQKFKATVEILKAAQETKK